MVWKYFKSEIQALFKWFSFIDFFIQSTKQRMINEDEKAKETKKLFFVYTWFKKFTNKL